MPTRRRFVQTSIGLAAIGAGAAHFPASAQNLELAKILCGFPPGGTSDAISRRVADKLRGNYASNVLVENKPGAGGQIAVTTLRDGAADGSVMLLTPSSMLSIYPFTYPKLPYKPLEDIQPVSLACRFNHSFSVGPLVPESVKTFKDFLAWARANPEKANYGSPAAGSMPHLVAALASALSGVPMKHIPYRGSAPAIQDVVGGQIAAASTPLGEALQFARAGKLRMLAVSGNSPSKFAPEVPTYQQFGLPITMQEWYGLFLPAKAPSIIATRAAAHVQAALAQPDLRASMAQMGMDVESSSPQVLSDLLRADAEEWRRLIKQIGFTADT